VRKDFRRIGQIVEMEENIMAKLIFCHFI
jgi:hypothetical protein